MKQTSAQMLQAILQVQAGALSVKAAAARLGISRKSYYQWERRALAAMLGALTPGRPGRPRTAPAGEMARLALEVARLSRENELLSQRLRIREVLGTAASRPRKLRGGDNGDGHRPETA